MTERVPFLELDCVSAFAGDTRVLNSASLRVHLGEMHAVIGQNGSGKSTLLRLLTGVQQPDGGVLRRDGEVIESRSAGHSGTLGACFLPSSDFLFRDVPARTQLKRIAEDHAEMDELIARLRLTECIGRSPGDLSGGERRRAEVCAALLLGAQLVALDEPLRGVSPIDADAIMATLREYAKSGRGVVVTGHELMSFPDAWDVVTWCYAGSTRNFPSFAAATADFQFRRNFLIGTLGGR